ncbi:MAG: hypothetical protein NKF70_00180 [Methanobacterium sp. ERen5]|nr:MAG: hypothetical protein NKF70_00180 [Methanobacterium sp. ERen5]
MMQDLLDKKEILEKRLEWLDTIAVPLEYKFGTKEFTAYQEGLCALRKYTKNDLKHTKKLLKECKI